MINARYHMCICILMRATARCSWSCLCLSRKFTSMTKTLRQALHQSYINRSLIMKGGALVCNLLWQALPY